MKTLASQELTATHGGFAPLNDGFTIWHSAPLAAPESSCRLPTLDHMLQTIGLTMDT